MVLEQELDFALGLAREASQEILCLAGGQLRVHYKNGNEEVTNIDMAIDKFLCEELGKRFSDDAILSEESTDKGYRLTKQRVWVVDPLDGTEEFINYMAEKAEENPLLLRHKYFGVHIGLSIQGIAMLGIVSFPALSTIYFAYKGGGAYCTERAGTIANKTRIAVSNLASLKDSRVVLHSPQRLAAVALAERCGFGEICYLPSAGSRICSVAAGLYDCVLSANGGSKEWDFCAPGIILEEAGGKITNMQGNYISYNKKDVRQKAGYIGTNKKIHPLLLSKLNS